MTDEELCKALRWKAGAYANQAADRIKALVKEREVDHANINLKADFIEATLDQLADMEARAEAAEAALKFTTSDGQRLLRKCDIVGVCETADLCFEDDTSTARCGPCAAKIAAAAEVELNKYTPSNPEAMRLRRELSAAEAALKAVDPAAIREAALRGAAKTMSPMLRSMISRTEAHRIILALIDKKEDTTNDQPE